MNPEKVSLMQYYIAMPIKRVFRRIKREISDIYRFKICGEWYCDGCDKYHSGRTVRYCINPDLDAVCFRHWKRDYFGQENRVYIGRENVTAKYYPALKKRFGVEGMGEPRAGYAVSPSATVSDAETGMYAVYAAESVVQTTVVYARPEKEKGSTERNDAT